METNEIISGHCLCDSVRIRVAPQNKEVGACHCEMCRRWGGGPLLVMDCGSNVTFDGEENINVFDSSDWAERGFCRHCGSHLFYRLKDNNQHMIPAGLFEPITGLKFDHQVFIDHKPDYYDFANDTHNMTGEECFAAFAPDSN